MSGFRWTADEVRAALETSSPADDVTFTGISTDTRKIERGSLFVALKGANFDAHDYLAQAVEQGAAAAGPPVAAGSAVHAVDAPWNPRYDPVIRRYFGREP